jgi:hypothetical protein
MAMLLGLDWDFDNQTLINLKKRRMVFKEGDWKVTTPIYPQKEEHM